MVTLYHPKQDEYSSKLPSTVQKRCFGDEEKQGMLMLAATTAKFGISSQAKKTHTMISEMPRACVT